MPWKKARLSEPDDVSPEVTVGLNSDLSASQTPDHGLRTPLLLDTAGSDCAVLACPKAGDRVASGGGPGHLPAHPTSMPEPAPADNWGRRYVICNRAKAGHPAYCVLRCRLD